MPTRRQSLAKRNDIRAKGGTFIDGLGRSDPNRQSIPFYFRQKDPIPKWEREELIEMGR